MWTCSACDITIAARTCVLFSDWPWPALSWDKGNRVFHSDTDTDIPVPLAAVRWILFFYLYPPFNPLLPPEAQFPFPSSVWSWRFHQQQRGDLLRMQSFSCSVLCPPSKPVKMLLIQSGHTGLEFYWTLQPHRVTPERITFRILPHQLQTPSTTKYNQVKTIRNKHLSIFFQWYGRKDGQTDEREETGLSVDKHGCYTFLVKSYSRTIQTERLKPTQNDLSTCGDILTSCYTYLNPRPAPFSWNTTINALLELAAWVIVFPAEWTARPCLYGCHAWISLLLL